MDYGNMSSPDGPLRQRLPKQSCAVATSSLGLAWGWWRSGGFSDNIACADHPPIEEVHVHRPHSPANGWPASWAATLAVARRPTCDLLQTRVRLLSEICSTVRDNTNAAIIELIDIAAEAGHDAFEPDLGDHEYQEGCQLKELRKRIRTRVESRGRYWLFGVICRG